MKKTRAKLEAIKKRRQTGEPYKAMNLGISEDAFKIALSYETHLRKYLHQPKLNYWKEGIYNIKGRVAGILERAATIANECQADSDTFVLAQFYWIHKWFQRHPKIYELQGKYGRFPAAWRAVEYQKLKEKDVSLASVFSPVISSKRVPQCELDTINDKRLNELCKVYNKDQKEILELFSASDYFDESWLNRKILSLKKGRL